MTIVGDGEQRRDFTHVSDVVNANILALDLNNKKLSGELFNIGTNKNYSINEIKDMIGGEFVYLEPRLGEARITLADNQKARKILKWEPKVNLPEWLKNI